jgi:hypothetical protein
MKKTTANMEVTISSDMVESSCDQAEIVPGA